MKQRIKPSVDFQENTLKYQNTMLAAQIDLIRHQLSNQDDNQYLKISHHLARRVRILTAYNKSAIERKLFDPPEEIKDENFECICGANQIEAIKYELIDNYDDKYNQFIKSAAQIEVQQKEDKQDGMEIEKVEQSQKGPSIIGDDYKEIFNQIIEERTQLISQIEDLKQAQKLPIDQFMKSQLFLDMVQLNNSITSTIFTLEKQLQDTENQMQDLMESHIKQIQFLREEYELKLIKLLETQQQQPQSERNQETQPNQSDNYKAQIQSLQKIIDDMSVEATAQRERNKQILTVLTEETNLKQQQILQINDLKSQISVYKQINNEERMDQIILRYDNHKQLILKIENEYIVQKSQELQKNYKEFIGYVKMRDDKVKSLEQIIDTRNHDIFQLKKQITSLLEELDTNSQCNASQLEHNKTLQKLLNETQQNESRAMKEKLDERIQIEKERQTFLYMKQQSDELIKSLQVTNDNLRKLTISIEQERTSFKDQIRQCQKSEQNYQQQLFTKEQDLLRQQEEIKVQQEKEKQVDGLIQKYIKKYEKAKVKQKILKGQLRKNESLNTSDDFVVLNEINGQLYLRQVILIKCLHMFCSPCLDDNQRNRNRACPVCRTKYSNEERRNIKLN
ncbi:hypothetical protein pb186bvf_005319 [Paramecium bursaria]